MPDIERLTYLLTRIRSQQASKEEYQELLSLIHADESGEVVALMDAFHASETPVTDAGGYDHTYWQAILTEILDTDKVIEKQPVRFLSLKKWWAAAAVVAIAAAGIYFLRPHKVQPPVVATKAPVRDVAPGGNKAMLTLADGSQITLDSASNGLLATQGQTKVTKLSNGQLVYDESANPEGQVLYNTMSTPLGGQYKLVLPDGSTVWLNAGSSITYPTAFIGKERSVSITGEAFFDVAKNEKMPFLVKTRGTVVEVLGTQFNVNAYTDEAAIATTLLEGAVRVNLRQQQLQLRPGQQARIAPQADKIAVVDHVNLQECVSWKDGFFSFDNADLPTVMRQLARWYNIEVKYEGAVPQRSFTGEIGRSLSLSQVLKGLTKTRIKYRIENGNRIVIQP
ncbi:FecR family protein [Chitinophaga polysaccharea]|uniref:FecR family protein n=1 Tax=Chitinophaga polysaccharea TaxID=1293035 RepID=A0A561P3S5_9BACT|nr:FecR family protein [Chitinophaga polysaccharea]TWF32759.1 FecR family protein [Chitinophaga polysaccharea]